MLTIPFIMVLGTVLAISRYMADGVAAGKYFWFCGVMPFVAVSALFAFIINRKNIKPNITDVLVFLFGLFGTGITWWHNGWSMRCILIILLVLLYFCFRIIITQGNKWNVYLLLLALVATGLVEAVWGLLQLYGYTYSQHQLFRTTGSFSNPGPYAGYLAVVLPLALYYLLHDWRIFTYRFRWKCLPFYVRGALAVLAFLTILLVLPATQSRAAWLGATGGCAVAGIGWFARKYNLIRYCRQHKKRVVVIFSIAIVLFSMACTALYYMKKDSADGRMLIWKISYETLKEHPLGVGAGNFSGAYAGRQADYFSKGNATEQEIYVADNAQYAFNEYLQIGIELGVFSLLLFLALLAFAIAGAIRKKRYMFLGALAALLVFAFFSYPFNVLPFPVVLALLLALCISDRSEEPDRAPVGKQVFVFTVLSAVCVLTVMCTISRYPAYKAYYSWNGVKTLYSAGAYENVLDTYIANEPYLSDRVQFLFEYALCLSKTGRFEESNRVLGKAIKISCDPMLHNARGRNFQALGDYVSAEENFIKAAHIVPNRHYPYYLLAKLYEVQGDTAKMCSMAQYVIDKKPKVPSRAVEEMKEEMKKLNCIADPGL